MIYQGENLLEYISSVKDSLAKVSYSLVELRDNALVFNRVEPEKLVSDAFFTDVTSMVDETYAQLVAVQMVQDCSEGITIQYLTQGALNKYVGINGY